MKMTAHEVRERLRKRFAAPEWALLDEVRSATGGAVNERYADAVAMNLWPSRGMRVHGFEIKVRRGDWLNELRKPNKSAPIQKFCDHWWVVAGGSNIVKLEELPPTWGLMTAAHGRLVISQDAPKLEAQPLDRPFIASLLRRASESLLRAEASDEFYQIGRQAGHEAGLEEGKRSSHYALKDYEKLKKAVDDFEKESGLAITKYTGGTSLGEAVVLVRRMMGNGVDIGRTLKNAKRPLELALSTLNALEQLSELDGSGVLSSPTL